MSAALTFLFIFVGVGESAPDFTNVLGFQSGFQIKLMIARAFLSPSTLFLSCLPWLTSAAPCV